MQDRFKFRVWKVNEKRMVEGVTYLNPLILDEEINPDEAKNNILMQCTGLKDKNGKLIYEGDILKTKEHNLCKEGELFKVFYQETLCQFLGKSLTTVILIIVLTLYEDEVIGNIYENPELLED